jgi:hypothetical protein
LFSGCCTESCGDGVAIGDGEGGEEKDGSENKSESGVVGRVVHRCGLFLESGEGGCFLNSATRLHVAK